MPKRHASTAVPQPPDDESPDALWARVTAVYEQERWHELPGLLRAVLVLAASGRCDGEEDALLVSARTLEVSAVQACGNAEAAEPALQVARNTYAQHRRTRDARQRAWLDVSFELMESRQSMLRRRWAEAGERLRRVFERLQELDLGRNPGRMLAATAHGQSAIVHCLLGRLPEALVDCEAGWQYFDSPELTSIGARRARHVLNWGNALIESERFDEALEKLRRGEEELGALIASGRTEYHWDLARLHLNRGRPLTVRGDFSAAIDSYQRALAHLNRDIRRRRRTGEDSVPVRASRANAYVNLGYVSHLAGLHDDAQRWLDRATRSYRVLKLTMPLLAEDAARAAVNRAHLLLEAGRCAAAHRAYRRAARQLSLVQEQGQAQLDGDVANALLGCARAQAREGRARAAARDAEAALGQLADLVRGGRMQHASAWQRGLRGVVAALMLGWRRYGDSGMPVPASVVSGFSAAFDRLRAQLVHPPPFGFAPGPQTLQECEADLEQLHEARRNDGGIGRWVPAWNDYQSAALRLLLDRTAMMLGDADPQWLGEQAERSRRFVRRCGELVAGNPEQGLKWLLSTRGLRVQRDALALSRDPRVVQLREQLAQLRRLEESLLASGAAGDAAQEGTLRLAGAPTAAARLPGTSAAAPEEWNRLSAQCRAKTKLLTDGGLLPRALRFDPEQIADRLPSGHLLALLARSSAEQIVVATVARPRGASAATLSFDRLAVSRQAPGLGCAQLLSVVSGPGNATRGMAALRRGSMTRMAGPATTASADGASAPAIDKGVARAALTAIAGDVSRSLRARLGTGGIDHVTVIPSDDLHALPPTWIDLRTAAPDAAVSIYPSVAAWFVQHDAPALPPRPHWAVAACAVTHGHEPLHWVHVERALSARLAGDSPTVEVVRPGDCVAGVHAFAGMGHGGWVGNNLAWPGLDLGEQGVLTAHELRTIEHCRAVLMSCCVLGRTHDVVGEPLGFMSVAFSQSTRFACGWLIDVPDPVACLFGLALRFALDRSGRESSDAVDWLEVFERTRTGIAAGGWPPGFGDWLAEHLPAVVEQLEPDRRGPLTRSYRRLAIGGALFAAPPVEMPEAMPWVVAFGH